MVARAFPWSLPPQTSPLTDGSGKATLNGYKQQLAIHNRTGGGTGIVPVVTNTPKSSTPDSLLAAVGTTQADSTVLNDDWNHFGTVNPGTACRIQALQPGQDVKSYNGGANDLLHFPPPGFQIDALGVDQPFVLAPGKTRTFECWSTTQLVSHGN